MFGLGFELNTHRLRNQKPKLRFKPSDHRPKIRTLNTWSQDSTETAKCMMWYIETKSPYGANKIQTNLLTE